MVEHVAFVWVKSESRLSELAQEAQVVGIEQADILDTVFQHRYSLWPHAEGETPEFSRIDVAIFQHFGVDHARSGSILVARFLAIT